MDAITLIAAVAELRPLIGSAVRSVLAAGLNTLCIELLTDRGPEGLLVCADPNLAYCVRAPSRGMRRPPTPLEGLTRRVLAGSRLHRLVHEGVERVCRFAFEGPEGEWCIAAELFGPRPNLVLIDAEGQVREAARHDVPRTAIGQRYVAPPPPNRPDPRALKPPEIDRILAAQVGSPAEQVQGFAGIAGFWAEEIVARATSPNALAQAVYDLLRQAERGPTDPQIVLDEGGQPAAVSPFPVRHLPPDRLRSESSLAEAIFAVRADHSERTARQVRDRVLRLVLRRMENRLRSRRTKLEVEAKEFGAAEEQQRMGALLVANQRSIARGVSEAVLPDPSAPGAQLMIPLDPALSAAANAELLFKKARRARRGIAQVAARLADTGTGSMSVQAWSERLAHDPAAAESIASEVLKSRVLAPRERALLAEDRPQNRPPSPAKVKPAKPAGGPSPRRFTSSEGFPILVGRNNEGNDYLTLHLARSEDLWLHAQNRAGSHVVIQVQKRTGGVPRRTLLEAAQLAAYYSQARNEGKVEVSYTLKKYVRKPRKAPPGLVTITQEKTVRVSPDKSLVNKLAAPQYEPA